MAGFILAVPATESSRTTPLSLACPFRGISLQKSSYKAPRRFSPTSPAPPRPLYVYGEAVAEAPKRSQQPLSPLLEKALAKIKRTKEPSVIEPTPELVADEEKLEAPKTKRAAAARARKSTTSRKASTKTKATAASADSSAQAKEKRKKCFVLDTNVILHDSSCIFSFTDNDLAIPITVLEELDRFKKGNELINWHAREFLRKIDDLCVATEMASKRQSEGSDELFYGAGVRIGEGHGRIRVALTEKESIASEVFARVFHENTADHRILNVVYQMQREQEMLEQEKAGSAQPIVLVSKDVNLRMKARALGLQAQDYNTDRDTSLVMQEFTGKRTIENVPSSVIDDFYREPFHVAAEELEHLISDPTANENFILKGPSRSVLAYYDEELAAYVRVAKEPASRISPRNAEQAFALSHLLNDKITLVSISGSAGTGKTLLALAAALQKHAKYQQIYLARPIVPLSNRDLGYLPGDMNAKIDPYMQPLYDNLAVIKHQFAGEGDSSSKKKSKNGGESTGKDVVNSEKLVITPLAYIRGRSLQECFFIVDEAQNLTPLEVKTIITRAGEGTKIIFTGDVQQIDTPYLDRFSNGLHFLISRMRGQACYAHITLEKGERSSLAKLASELL
eukprot:tig00021352_g20690.t1